MATTRAGQPASTTRLAGAIRTARQQAGLDHAGLAADLGVTEDEVGCWERGSAQPPWQRLVDLKAVLPALPGLLGGPDAT